MFKCFWIILQCSWSLKLHLVILRWKKINNRNRSDLWKRNISFALRNLMHSSYPKICYWSLKLLYILSSLVIYETKFILFQILSFTKMIDFFVMEISFIITSKKRDFVTVSVQPFVIIFSEKRWKISTNISTRKKQIFNFHVQIHKNCSFLYFSH